MKFTTAKNYVYHVTLYLYDQDPMPMMRAHLLHSNDNPETLPPRVTAASADGAGRSNGMGSPPDTYLDAAHPLLQLMR